MSLLSRLAVQIRGRLPENYPANILTGLINSIIVPFGMFAGFFGSMSAWEDHAEYRKRYENFALWTVAMAIYGGGRLGAISGRTLANDIITWIRKSRT